MIYTLTLNPSIDYHIWIPQLTEGTIHQVQKEWKDAGGKGINVSKVLKGLGMESIALGFTGGFTGAFIQQQVENMGILHRFVSVEGDSRINVKLKTGTETDLSGVAPAVSQEALKQLFAEIDELSEGDYLVLAGSVPDSIPDDIYRTVVKRLAGKGVRIFLDAKGGALRSCLSERPFLIKPNHHELGELFGVSVDTPAKALEYGRETVVLGAQNVIVSMAGQGAVFVNEREAYYAQIPQRKAVNSIGAGDSMVAGFLYMYEQTGQVEPAFRFAVAAGSSTALSEGFCTHEKIQQFMPSITIDRLL
ncbi:1-phosphofructokinase [Aneurinibacillus tyrosinisolvens]|uniref:1-phosphofructokinase n=1 Tax=Aneurinibacillus tyrosinisolvens TaxID=1443435 RepID=UPI00063FBA96|nr:1-phosphofructokinase [Aneurinibacillus tyrosinisolvens]